MIILIIRTTMIIVIYSDHYYSITIGIISIIIILLWEACHFWQLSTTVSSGVPSLWFPSGAKGHYVFVGKQTTSIGMDGFCSGESHRSKWMIDMGVALWLRKPCHFQLCMLNIFFFNIRHTPFTFQQLRLLQLVITTKEFLPMASLWISRAPVGTQAPPSSTVPSGNWTVCSWTRPIYSWFTNWWWWFSMANC